MTNDTGRPKVEILKEKPDSPRKETKIVGGQSRGPVETLDKNPKP